MTESVDGTHLIRRALAGLDPSTILEYVDTLDLSARGGTDVLVLAPLRNLHRGRQVEHFVLAAPAPAVRFVGEVLSHEALERVVELLGDDADAPTLEQLTQAVDELLVGGENTASVALMLAVAAANNVPASGHCRVLLESRDDLRPPDVDALAPAGVVSVHEVDPAIKEQRRQRREAQRRAKQRTQSRPPTRPTKSRPEPSSATREPAAPVATLRVTRRASILTPTETLEFAASDERRGEVVFMRIEHDPTSGQDPGESDKARPALVVAASADALLVRPIYSKPREDRVLVVGWNRVGLERPSYVSVERLRVELAGHDAPKLMGRLSDEEWNALL